MDFDEYVAARHGTLLRAAVLMGCAEAHAPRLVADVLAVTARRIRRSDDPDDLVLDALASVIPGARSTAFGSATSPDVRADLLMSTERVDSVGVGPIDLPPAELNRPVVGVLALLVALLVAAGLVGPGQPGPQWTLAAAQVPSLFAYDGESARALLTQRGVAVVEQPVQACEPGGRVVGTQPPAGAVVGSGDTVIIRTALPSIVPCLARRFSDRALAWQFIDFATGRGPAPRFAPLVRLVVDRGAPTTLSHLRAVDRDSWEGLSAATALAEAASEMRWVGTAYLLPELTVTSGTPPRSTCGIPRPILAGERSAVSITIAIPGETSCPVRVDLYRSYGDIDSVMLYTSKSASSL